MKGLSDRDFPEDFNKANGLYIGICANCGKEFMGHKRRAICKLCKNAAMPAMPKIEAGMILCSKRKDFTVVDAGKEELVCIFNNGDDWDVLSDVLEEETIIKIYKYKSDFLNFTEVENIHSDTIDLIWTKNV